MHCIARLDYDSRDEMREGLKRMAFVVSLLKANRYHLGPCKLRRSRTRRGWHVELQARVKLTPVQMVALQAILGSDYRREMFNLFRALALPSAPDFWKRLGHWNVLHRERVT